MADAMTKATHAQEDRAPRVRHTRDGYAFDANADVWWLPDISRAFRFDFNTIPASSTVIASIKTVMAWYAAHGAVGSMSMFLFLLRDLLDHEARWLGSPVETISAESILRYRSALDPRNERSLANITGLLKRWGSLGEPGITDNVVKLLAKVSFKQPPRAEEVLTMHPTKGPFTDLELTGLVAGLKGAYADGKITQEEYVLAGFFPLLGQRPVQYAAMKLADVRVVHRGENDSAEYFVALPRAKIPGQPARSKFVHVRVHPEIGRPLARHVEEVEQRFAGRLPDPSQAPLFPAETVFTERPPGFEHHRNARALSEKCISVYKRLGVNSERTGEPLHVNPIRFRRTFGTRAAEAGHSALTIAEMMGHTTTQSLRHYVQTTPAILERIDRAMAKHLAPIVAEFKGKIETVEDKSDAAAVIADPRFDPSMKPMGRCAHHGPCNLLAPIACYVCPNYRPLADGPHEAVFSYLIGERERLYTEHGPRIASTVDRPLLAVARVVQLCDEYWKNKEKDE